MPSEKDQVLRPKLEQAHEALDAALDEACQVTVESANTAQLIKLEESLTVAREAAKTAITLLRRLHSDQEEADETRSEAHRVFVDDRGVQWDAFAVYPSPATLGRRSALPNPYHAGWLSIQCPETVRRLTPIPEGWRKLSREEFCQLLEKAESAPRRTRTEKGKLATPDRMG